MEHDGRIDEIRIFDRALTNEEVGLEFERNVRETFIRKIDERYPR